MFIRFENAFDTFSGIIIYVGILLNKIMLFAKLAMNGAHYIKLHFCCFLKHVHETLPYFHANDFGNKNDIKSSIWQNHSIFWEM